MSTLPGHCRHCLISVFAMAKAEDSVAFRQEFDNHHHEMLSKKRQDNNHTLSCEEYNTILDDLRDIQSKRFETQLHYRRMVRFQTCTVSGKERFINPLQNPDNPRRYFVADDELLDVSHKLRTGYVHFGRNQIQEMPRKTHCNITKEIICLFLSLCKSCQRKRSLKTKGYVSMPIFSEDLNSLGKVDLIKIQSQPRRGYKSIMVYEDHLKKFVLLIPLHTKTAAEVSRNRFKVFSILGASSILHSDNGQEFFAALVEKDSASYDGMQIVHGKPWRSHSQGSVERDNQDVESIIATWMADNSTTDWVSGLNIVQLMKNNRHHSEIKRSSYAALFGCDAKLGLLFTSFPSEVVGRLVTEEDLEEVVESIQFPGVT